MSYEKITPIAGLKLEWGDGSDGDTSPTSSTLISAEYLVDGDTGRPQSYQWIHPESFGLDLGSSQAVDRLVCHCISENGGAFHAWNTDYDHFEVYKSDDNASWDLVEAFDSPTVVATDGDKFAFELILSASQTARYFKVRFNEDYAVFYQCDGGAFGQIALITEIEAYISVSQSIIVNDIENPAKVNGITLANISKTNGVSTT